MVKEGRETHNLDHGLYLSGALKQESGQGGARDSQSCSMTFSFNVFIIKFFAIFNLIYLVWLSMKEYL